MNAPDVLVIGGGVIGCAIARRLALDGFSTMVVERGVPGDEASSAAAGMLSPLAEAERPGPFLDLLLRARQVYPDYANALREETTIDVGYDAHGTLLVALSEADEAELEERFRWQAAAGLEVERLEPAVARELEPALDPAVRWALRCAGDHQVDNRLLARALWAAAAHAGASFRLGVEALRVGGAAAGGVTLELADGSRLAAGAIVVAAGSWAGRIEGLPLRLPVRPVHGELLALEAFPSRFRHVIDSPRCYLVPRADGRLIVGTTAELRGFRKSVTAGGVVRLLRGALEISPQLAELPLASFWSGLRPGTPDGLPILGRDPEYANLFYATGHFRNGILLAPLTGELIAQLIRDGGAEIDLTPFQIDRFRA